MLEDSRWTVNVVVLEVNDVRLEVDTGLELMLAKCELLVACLVLVLCLWLVFDLWLVLVL